MTDRDVSKPGQAGGAEGGEPVRNSPAGPRKPGVLGRAEAFFRLAGLFFRRIVQGPIWQAVMKLLRDPIWTFVGVVVALLACVAAYFALPAIYGKLFPTPEPIVAGAPTTPPATPAIKTPTPEPSPTTYATPTPEWQAGMLPVPGGSFRMGSADADQEALDNELPAHPVSLAAFWIDQTEVTNEQYARCVEAGACAPPHQTSSTTRLEYYGNPDFDDYPVIYVDWFQAAGYCAWAGKRLPSEAEWEYAARGPEDRRYPWGDDFAVTPAGRSETRLNLCDAAHCGGWEENLPDPVDDGQQDTAEVGSYPDGASWVGALDMAGNAWEWTADWYRDNYYASAPVADPLGPFGPAGKDLRVLRGGGWDFHHRFARTAARLEFSPQTPDDSAGFRCAKSETPLEVRAGLAAPLAGQEVSLSARVQGTVGPIPGDRQLWLLVRPAGENAYFPQPGPLRPEETGEWSASVQVGSSDELEAGKTYTVSVALADINAGRAFQDFYADRHQEEGMLLPLGVDILDSVNVKRVNPVLDLDSHAPGARVGDRETLGGSYQYMGEGLLLYGIVELEGGRFIPYGPFEPLEPNGRWSIQAAFPWPGGGEREVRFHALAVLASSRAGRVLAASVGSPLNPDDLQPEDWQVIFGPLAPRVFERAERLVFTSDKPGNDDIYIVNADGSGLERMTGNAAEDTDPAWSPDGKSIAFASRRDGKMQVYIVEIEGGAVRPLVPGRVFEGDSPAWSPDGQWIAFQSNQDGKEDLYKASVASGEVVRLTEDDWDDWDPAWSPDGQKILFTSTRAEDDGGESELFVMDASGGSLDRLTTNETWEDEPTWSPDGSKILYTLQQGGGRDIYEMLADGTGMSLAASRDYDGYASYAPDGGRIVLHSSVDRQQLFIAEGVETRQIDTGLSMSRKPAWSPLPGDERIAFSGRTDGDWELYSMWDDGSGLLRLTDNHAYEVQPRLSPDGRQVVFASNLTGDNEIYVAGALEQSDASQWTRLTDDDGRDEWPAWSPDGSRVAFTSDRAGDFDIYVTSPTGAGLVQVTDDPADDTYPAWTPDGQGLVFFSKRSGNGDIFLVNLADPGNVIPLVTGPSFDWSPTLSPDGLTLLFASSRDSGSEWATEIYALRLLEGGEPDRLTDDSGLDAHPRWSSDGDRIYFTSYRWSVPYDIWVMRADGRDPQDLTREPGETREDHFGP
jgi:Tol biopolymer transport system component/formylglycine-generating enzyme required for sulfatase activity